MYWTGTQELVVKRCKIINSRGEGKHVADVALVLYSLAQKMYAQVRTVNDQIISARFETMTHPVTIIQVYTPSAEAEEDGFHQQFLYKFTELGQQGT